jgi:predicted O-methyltransferase YrrM
MSSSATFDDTLDAVSDVDGWMTPAQARLLWRSAQAVPAEGQIVEIGSFRGRSTIVLGRAAPPDAVVVAIEPHGGNDRGPQELEGFEEEAAEDHRVFTANLEAAGVAERVHHVRKWSDVAHGDVTGGIDLLYIDGAHRYRPALDDIRRWGLRVRPGGTMLIHDSFSSIGVTLALARHLFTSASWSYVGRAGSLAEYGRADGRTTTVARFRNGTRQAAQLGWFARNLAVKGLITLHLRSLTRFLGYDPAMAWPY